MLVLRSLRLFSILFQINCAQTSKFSFEYFVESGTDRTHLSSAEKLPFLPISYDPHPASNPLSELLIQPKPISMYVIFKILLFITDYIRFQYPRSIIILNRAKMFSLNNSKNPPK